MPNNPVHPDNNIQYYLDLGHTLEQAVFMTDFVLDLNRKMNQAHKLGFVDCFLYLGVYREEDEKVLQFSKYFLEAGERGGEFLADIDGGFAEIIDGLVE